MLEVSCYFEVKFFKGFCVFDLDFFLNEDFEQWFKKEWFGKVRKGSEESLMIKYQVKVIVLKIIIVDDIGEIFFNLYMVVLFIQKGEMVVFDDEFN